jgi:DNA-binding MarR family transcriptional regulator
MSGAVKSNKRTSAKKKGKLQNKRQQGEQLERVKDSRSLGPLDQLISVRLSRVQIRLRRGFAAATAGNSLRRGTISSLGLIAANPGISQKELTEHTVIDKSGMVAIVDSLEKLGWAVRKPSKSDRRRHALFVTPQGLAQLEILAAAVRKVEAEMLAKISPEELEYLRGLLDRMYLSCMSYVRQR